MILGLLSVVALAVGWGWWRLLVRSAEDEERRHERWLYEHGRSQPRDEWDR